MAPFPEHDGIGANPAVSASGLVFSQVSTHLPAFTAPPTEAALPC